MKIINYQELRDTLKNGDMLLCKGNSLFSKLIRYGTKSEFSHIGIIYKDEFLDRILVYESVETIGVRCVPLSKYLYNYDNKGNGYNGELSIYRHNDYNKINIKLSMQFIVNLLGFAYDNIMILKIATKIIFNCKWDFSQNKLFICSEFAEKFFKENNILIQRNTNNFIVPGDFNNDKNIKLIGRIK